MTEQNILVVGLTGSIGMGKSTVAAFFEDMGVPVLHADKVVHQLYAAGGKAVSPVGGRFPSAVKDGAIDRGELGKHVLHDEAAMKELEAIVHPLVAEQRQLFLHEAVSTKQPVAVLDIPLLFETKLQNEVDAVVVVSCPADVQQQRVLARPGMTEEKFRAILLRQVPDAEKRQLADFIVDTSVSINETKAAVQELLSSLKGRTGSVYKLRGVGL